MDRMVFDTPLTEEEQQFAEENHRLIYKALRKFRCSNEYYDVAAIGYVKAVKKYFHRRNFQKYSFSTIAFKMISSDLRHCKEQEYNKTCNDIYDCDNDGGNNYSIWNKISDPDDCFKSIYDNDEIERAFTLLSETEQKIFIMKSQGYIGIEIARALGYRSKSHINFMSLNAQTRIRMHLAGERETENIIRKGKGMNTSSTVNFEKIKRLYEEGLHDNEIARRAECASATVHRWRKRNGLPGHPWKNEDGTPMRKPKQKADGQSGKAVTDTSAVSETVVFKNGISDTFNRINTLISTIKKDDSPETTESYKTLLKTIFEDGLNGYFNNFGS